MTLAEWQSAFYYLTLRASVISNADQYSLTPKKEKFHSVQVTSKENQSFMLPRARHYGVYCSENTEPLWKKDGALLAVGGVGVLCSTY